METTRPVARIEPKWLATFSTQLAQTQALASFNGQPDLLMLGDSITEGCGWNPEFKKPLEQLRILNYGIGGDTTQSVLWRIEHGLLNGLRPRFATLLIGVNNLWPDTPADHVAAGAIACGNAMRARLPECVLLHFGVLPLGAHVLHLNHKVDTINAAIRDACSSYNARFVSIRDEFLNEDGSEKPGLLALDGVHLSSRGYGRWGTRLAELLDGQSQTA